MNSDTVIQLPSGINLPCYESLVYISHNLRHFLGSIHYRYFGPVSVSQLGRGPFIYAVHS